MDADVRPAMAAAARKLCVCSRPPFSNLNSYFLISPWYRCCFLPTREVLRDPPARLSLAAHCYPDNGSLPGWLPQPANGLRSGPGNRGPIDRRSAASLKIPDLAPVHPSFTSDPPRPPVSLVVAHCHSARLPWRRRDRPHRMPLFWRSTVSGLTDPDQRRLTRRPLFPSPRQETD